MAAEIADLKILVVEDSEPLRKLLRKHLSKLGITNVIEAVDGQHALRILRATKPDLIITDLDMPKMNGLDLVRSIREKDHKIPIMMSTVHAERDNVIEAIHVGVSSYLLKPFSPVDLASKIKALFERMQSGENVEADPTTPIESLGSHETSADE